MCIDNRTPFTTHPHLIVDTPPKMLLGLYFTGTLSKIADEHRNK